MELHNMLGRTVYTGDVTKLEPNQVFVFGSNLNGFHGAGSAGYASFNEKGNIWRNYNYGAWPKGKQGKWNVKGQAEGYQIGTEGASYAIPTVTRAGAVRSISPENIRESIKRFLRFANDNPELHFFVAYSGNKNLNGYTPSEMASFFIFNRELPSNVIFQKDFCNLIFNL